MGRLGLGAALVALVFSAGCWAGSAWTRQRHDAVEASERAAIAAQTAEIRAREVERLRMEVEMDLQLGEVIANARDVDQRDVVFDAGRMRGLIPAR